MNIRAGILLMLAVAAPLAPAAGVDCVHVRVGYMNQHRPPYWMGDGDKVADPPGASVDLIHDAVIAAGFGCEPSWVRLPVARLKVALAAGDIDMTTLGESAYYPAEIALPRDKAGNIDRNRAMHNTLVVLVRAKDKLLANANPMHYFPGKMPSAPEANNFVGRLCEPVLTRYTGGGAP